MGEKGNQAGSPPGEKRGEKKLQAVTGLEASFMSFTGEERKARASFSPLTSAVCFPKKGEGKKKGTDGSDPDDSTCLRQKKTGVVLALVATKRRRIAAQRFREGVHRTRFSLFHSPSSPGRGGKQRRIQNIGGDHNG